MAVSTAGFTSSIAGFADLRKKNNKIISVQTAYWAGSVHTTRQTIAQSLVIDECALRQGVINRVQCIDLHILCLSKSKDC